MRISGLSQYIATGRRNHNYKTDKQFFASPVPNAIKDPLGADQYVHFVLNASVNVYPVTARYVPGIEAGRAGL